MIGSPTCAAQFAVAEELAARGWPEVSYTEVAGYPSRGDEWLAIVDIEPFGGKIQIRFSSRSLSTSTTMMRYIGSTECFGADARREFSCVDVEVLEACHGFLLFLDINRLAAGKVFSLLGRSENGAASSVDGSGPAALFSRTFEMKIETKSKTAETVEIAAGVIEHQSARRGFVTRSHSRRTARSRPRRV
jgi:hypothetical protein